MEIKIKKRNVMLNAACTEQSRSEAPRQKQSNKYV